LLSAKNAYTVPGGGVIAVAIHAGDHVRLVDVEGHDTTLGRLRALPGIALVI
jgi:hypothetical protein